MEWIDVNDRLPKAASLDDRFGYGKNHENVKAVITRDKWGRIDIGTAMYLYIPEYLPEYKIFGAGYGWYGNHCGQVIYWADLPKLPEGLNDSR